ncbi:hypothetical protein [Flavobacterium sp. MMS24-S5]|uniref:hypothetical protein n=1 Tax=Flavobacterium sp. MMS24-S5 TaxID=3416605 RepID=UPI003D02EF5A
MSFQAQPIFFTQYLSFRLKGEITLVTTKIGGFLCGVSSVISPFSRNDKLDGKTQNIPNLCRASYEDFSFVEMTRLS